MSAERWLVVVALLLFGLSLALPAITGSGFPSQTGMDVLKQGASGWRDGVLAWYANPVLGLALVLSWTGRSRAALGCGVLSLLLGLSSYFAGAIATGLGRNIPPFSFGAGFYVWLLALAVACLAAGTGIYKVSSRPV